MSDVPEMAEAAAEPTAAVDESQARLVSSFVPALVLQAMDSVKTSIEPPTTHEYEAVALFAVRERQG